MIRGRRPKPSALVDLHGKTSHARKPRTEEPKPVGELSSAPEWLTPKQKEGWQYAIENAPMGLLKRIDRSALAAWVVAEDLHRQAAILVAETGLLVKAGSGPESAMVANPSINILNRQAMLMFRAMADLGFSPASRPRIGQLVGTVDHGPSLREATGGSVVSLDDYLRSAPAD